MKKSELRQLIRKQIRESVNEAEFKHINPSENKIKDAMKS